MQYKVYLLQKATRFCPNSAQMYNDFGVAYYQRNEQYDRQRASDEFNEALRIDPDYDVARNNLARL
jgi:Flp pilus assembly protein TadD